MTGTVRCNEMPKAEMHTLIDGCPDKTGIVKMAGRSFNHPHNFGILRVFHSLLCKKL